MQSISLLLLFAVPCVALMASAQAQPLSGAQAVAPRPQELRLSRGVGLSGQCYVIHAQDIDDSLRFRGAFDRACS